MTVQAEVKICRWNNSESQGRYQQTIWRGQGPATVLPLELWRSRSVLFVFPTLASILYLSKAPFMMQSIFTVYIAEPGFMLAMEKVMAEFEITIVERATFKSVMYHPWFDRFSPFKLPGLNSCRPFYIHVNHRANH